MSSHDSKPLRILQIIHYFRTGGLEQLALRLASAYHQQGYVSHVLAYETGPMLPLFEQHGVVTHLLPRPPRASLGYVFRLAGFLRVHAFDVVHTHHIGPMLYGVPAARLCRMVSIHTTHSNEHLYPKTQTPPTEGQVPSQRKLYQTLAPLCHHITTVNPQLQEYLQQNLHIKTPISTIPNGVDPQTFHGEHDTTALKQTLGIPQDAPWMGVIGRLAPEKGHRYLLQAMQQLRCPAHLLVIGDGPLREELISQTHTLNIADRVHFLGLRHDLPELFSTLDLMILPSLREGLPLALLESLCSGVPVVGTTTGNVADILHESRGGHTVSPGNDVELAQAIQSLLENTSLRQQMSQTAKRWIQQHYNQDEMIQRYLLLYHLYHQRIQTIDWLKPLRQTMLALFARYSP